MDKGLIRRRFARAAGTYAKNAGMQCRVAEEMTGRIEQYVPKIFRNRVLEVGCGTGIFTRMYRNRFHPERLFLNDICPEMNTWVSDFCGENTAFLPGDAEALDFPSGLGMVVSCSTVQWFENPERFFSRIRSHLVAGGYLAFSTFGEKNMLEVAELSGVSLRYIPFERLKNILHQYYTVEYSREEINTLSFLSPYDVLKHLKATGVTGITSSRWTRNALADFCRDYERKYSDGNGKVTLTYHPLYFICKTRCL